MLQVSRVVVFLHAIIQPLTCLLALGWTTLQNLYLFNGTWFIVTDEPSKFPSLDS